MLWLAVAAGGAQAATITVDTTADFNDTVGSCSLREAVRAANQNAAVDSCTAGDDFGEGNSDTITFAQSLAGQTIVLSGDSLDIQPAFPMQGQPAPALIIQGPEAGNAGSIVIDGGGEDRVFNVPVENPLVFLRLIDLTVTNGRVATGETAAEGGGIRVAALRTRLELDTVRVTGNAVTSELNDALGGGIYAGGPFAIVDSVISGNTANAGFAAGGGLYFRRPFVQVQSPTPNVVQGSKVSGNEAISSSFAAFGGGLFLAGSSESTVPERVEVLNTTISGNNATANGAEGLAVGGGFYAEEVDLTLFLNNATVAENYAGATAGNDAGGGFAVADATVRLANTLVATNGTQGTGPDCALAPFDTSGGILSLGFNLIGNAADCPIESMASDQVGTSAAPIDPLLGLLGNNGGATRTHALQMGSPAIDAGGDSTAEIGCLDTDQRGQPRPQDGDGSGTAECDIGAYEAAAVNQPPTVVQAIGDQTLSLAGGDLTIDLAPVFEDPEGQPLTFSAESSNPEVATATVEGTDLIVTAVSPGTATITVTAVDSMGGFRRAAVPISGGSGGLSAAVGGGCTLASTGRPVPPDPLLWLLVVAALGWRVRRGMHAARIRSR